MLESPTHPDAIELRALGAWVADLETADDDGARIELLEQLERLKAAAAATQARIVERMHRDQVEKTPATAESKRRRSLGAQVGLARRESPHRGARLLGLGLALVHDLPETLAALARGDINETRALIVATESSDLSREDRLTLDRELAARLPGLGDRETQLAAQRLVLRLDQAGAVRRRERAHGRRHVTGRRLPDGMAVVSATVSDVAYASIMNALHSRATAELSSEEPDARRTRSQALADIVVQRLTGQAVATAAPLRIDLVVSAETLLGDDDEPAELPGFGPIPASVARKLVGASPAHATRIRRLFRLEDTDRLVAMESTARHFDGALADFIRLRDQVCRTPWCNSPIRHLDHVEAAARGGPTSESNGQGLCEACNYTKESPGWRHAVDPDGPDPFAAHEVDITTPTGHTHRSRSPGLLSRPTRTGSRAEIYVSDFILIA